MLDGYLADGNLLDADDHFTSVLAGLPERLGMHKIAEPLVVRVGANNKKDPGGLSGFVMIAESHISFHSFPNRAFISIDVYTCNTDVDLSTVTDCLVGAFGIKDFDTQIVGRGLRYPTSDIVRTSGEQ